MALLQPGDQASGRGYDAPPRKPGAFVKIIANSAGSTRAPGLGRYFAVCHYLAWGERQKDLPDVVLEVHKVNLEVRVGESLGGAESSRGWVLGSEAQP